MNEQQDTPDHPRHPGGRPPFQPNTDQRKAVKSMSAWGIPHDDIAKAVGISPTTLRKHFRDELDRGMLEANAAVAASLFRHATGNGKGAVTAGIFWAKTRMGWTDRPHQIEISGPGGGPIKTEDTSARELIASRLASIAARHREGGSSGGSDGSTD